MTPRSVARRSGDYAGVTCGMLKIVPEQAFGGPDRPGDSIYRRVVEDTVQQ